MAGRKKKEGGVKPGQVKAISASSLIETTLRAQISALSDDYARYCRTRKSLPGDAAMLKQFVFAQMAALKLLVSMQGSEITDLQKRVK